MKTPVRIILAALLLLCCAGCIYQHPSTGLTYILHDEYETFNFDESPLISPSNFVGYCWLPMDERDDERAQSAIDVITQQLQEHGYVRVAQDELLAEPRLIPKTFMVGLGYQQSFAYNTIQLELSLYQLDMKERKNKLFWVWHAKCDGFPICRNTVEPAAKDIFKNEPLDWGRKDPLFPRMGASSNQLEQFMIDLNQARLLQEIQRNQTP